LRKKGDSEKGHTSSEAECGVVIINLDRDGQRRKGRKDSGGDITVS